MPAIPEGAPGEAYDVLVVGAGPAGLAAASLCARSGLATALFDQQASPGGHAHRAITTTPLTDPSILGAEYWTGTRIVEEFLGSGAKYVPGAIVQGVSRELQVAVSVDGSASFVNAKRVILATGARERPFTIPGAALPGVTSVGTAQARLLESGLLPEGRAVLAGSGPLLWQFAWQCANAGVKFVALLDTTPQNNRWRAAAHAPSFLVSPYFLKSLRLRREVRSRIPVVEGVTALRAEGGSRLAQVTCVCGDGSERAFAADTLLLHQGIVPNADLAVSTGVEHRWIDAQAAWCPMLDRDGSTSIAGIAIAGDGAGIAGREAAGWRGVIAANAAIRALRPRSATAVDKIARVALARFLRGRPFLDRLYRPAGDFRAGK